MVPGQHTVAAVLLSAAALVVAHGDDQHGGMNMGNMNMSTVPTVKVDPAMDPYNLPAYAGLSQETSVLLAHVVLMTSAWLFILPIGVVFSVSRSRFALPVQLVFLILNGLGLLFGTIYNARTPDLYENNAHHTIGWIATWIMTAQVIMSLLFVFSGRLKRKNRPGSERAAFLPISVANMAQHNVSPYSDARWSGDSGHGTDRSSSQNSRDNSPTDPLRYAKPEAEPEDDDDNEPEFPLPRRTSFFRNNLLERFVSKKAPLLFSVRLLKPVEIAYNIIDRTILILAFIALSTGGVTYAGIFRGGNVFNGLAHFIKGGIFFWYGLLTLGRWMGCFADLGWAWNVKPTRSEVGQWKASLPSAEFVESFVIFLYGSTNVFLEHLAAWGDAWTAQDLEHVSISVMFFGGGLCGMFIESKKVRDLLNTEISIFRARSELSTSEAQELRAPPKNYATSLNPLPALIIFLLGVMMSSHHQDSMVSTMVHKQWGTLLCGFSFARFVTYIVMYLSPPKSVYPSRPPSEMIAAFCLISGGLVFMASTKDLVHLMESNGLMSMFVLTVTVGFTAFLMAYEIFVLALKGWALRREMNSASRF